LVLRALTTQTCSLLYRRTGTEDVVSICTSRVTDILTDTAVTTNAPYRILFGATGPATHHIGSESAARQNLPVVIHTARSRERRIPTGSQTQTALARPPTPSRTYAQSCADSLTPPGPSPVNLRKVGRKCVRDTNIQVAYRRHKRRVRQDSE
jgi:hypothetical protein